METWLIKKEYKQNGVNGKDFDFHESRAVLNNITELHIRYIAQALVGLTKDVGVKIFPELFRKDIA